MLLPSCGCNQSLPFNQFLSFPEILKIQSRMIHQYLRTWFFSFLFSSLVLAEWNPKDFLKREHSLIKPFTGKPLQTTNFNEI